MGLDNNRIKHILSVAYKMKRIVEETPGLYDVTPQEAFMIGYLHDVGYVFTDNQIEHEHLGGELLKEMGYKFWREIYFHGDPMAEYDSKELRLLNAADLTTDRCGNDVTLQERLDDIRNRYGSNSKQYLNAFKLAKKIGIK